MSDSHAGGAGGNEGIPLPTRIIVSLRAGVVLAVANILCVVIFATAWTRVKAEPKLISVTGSARKQIQSDLIVWNVKVSATEPDITKAYDRVKASADKTLAYLREQGIAPEDTTVSSVWTTRHYVKNEKGQDTDQISGYELYQTVNVSSKDVPRVTAVERKITELLKDGVFLESTAPRYLYTKMADLKVSMLAEATRDATTRAQQIAGSSGARLGAIREAKMGVMQINAIHSDEATGSGVNDTTSFDKEITAVVSTRFGLE